MARIDRLIAFMKLMHEFQAVERLIPVPKTKRFENDTEHSYMLAMLAWFVVSREKLPLDINKVIQYALVHDLVEAYAGDTDAFDKVGRSRSDKHEREEKARMLLSGYFPDFPELHELIAAYETRTDAESKFVYALDKLAPVITIYLAAKHDTPQWHTRGIPWSLEQQHKNERIALSPEVFALWKEFALILEKEKDRLFPKEDPTDG